MTLPTGGELRRVLHRPRHIPPEPDGRRQGRQPAAVASGLVDHQLKRRSLHPHRGRFRRVERQLCQLGADSADHDDSDGGCVRRIAADRQRRPLHHHCRFSGPGRSFLAALGGSRRGGQRVHDYDAPLARSAQRQQQQHLVAEAPAAPGA